MTYTIQSIHPITISGHENGPIEVWEIKAIDQRGTLHQHRVSYREFNYRMKNRDWFSYSDSADLKMLAY